MPPHGPGAPCRLAHKAYILPLMKMSPATEASEQQVHGAIPTARERRERANSEAVPPWPAPPGCKVRASTGKRPECRDSILPPAPNSRALWLVWAGIRA
ncbi:MAG: hypothetical protein OXU61_09985 [Gammaproteobacteria bacterium]|nr:hypothetical protein [Gammaproteobacteria bacterium]